LADEATLDVFPRRYTAHWKVGVAFDIRKMLEAGKASIHRGAQITTEIAMRQCILWEAF
jgi:hypothetical protein